MESSRSRKKRSAAIYDILCSVYNERGTALVHINPFQLLVATILSAQCTDAQVNRVTPALFNAYPTPQKLAKAGKSHLEQLVYSTGFYKAKARNLLNMSQKLVSDFRGEVPDTIEELVTLPGVGRKTANCVLGHAFGQPGITVDTHLKRLSMRMGFTQQTDPVKIESDLAAIWPEETWTEYSTVMIRHGREVCSARKPDCLDCPVAELCPRIGIDS